MHWCDGIFLLANSFSVLIKSLFFKSINSTTSRLCCNELWVTKTVKSKPTNVLPGCLQTVRLRALMDDINCGFGKSSALRDLPQTHPQRLWVCMSGAVQTVGRRTSEHLSQIWRNSPGLYCVHRGRDAHEVRVTFSLHQQNLTSSALSPSGHPCQIWRNSLNGFLGGQTRNRWTDGQLRISVMVDADDRESLTAFMQTFVAWSDKVLSWWLRWFRSDGRISWAILGRAT